ncbi:MULTISPECIES: DUF1499 domain-containing protein [unclassified Rhizobium]|uniref:DUF1499 domain-containing protein n=1 Tax=unclassified Rhizobium TaxID=2613769 RepID=UPI000EA95834|nr:MULTISPECIES: DUF1499 domain-containing protein [unclassified Rhizobium]AYG65469.1 DUF1499 domain-containing protein [Rhizobium sp. CCGE531]AYG71952.1 DUF1499 domain-containing protein [Rhizobium sp. CCGE532]
MTIRFDRPVSHAARAARLIASFALVLCGVTLIGYRFGPLETPYFVLLLLISAGCAVLSVLLALVGLAQLWRNAAIGGVSAVKALVYAALPLAIFGFGAERHWSRPPIYEISTDLNEPPEWLATPDARQMWLPPRHLVTQQEREAQFDAYPALISRRYEGASDRVLEAVRKVARDRHITIVKADGADVADPNGNVKPKRRARSRTVNPAQNDSVVGDVPDIVPVPTPRPFRDGVAEIIRQNTDVILQGETRTRILGLPCDLVIRIREEAETTLVDIRVASRYGQNDLGVSADLADGYLKALDAELLGIAGS